MPDLRIEDCVMPRFRVHSISPVRGANSGPSQVASAMKELCPKPVSEVKNKYWVCAQIGAREHYAIPRALAARDALANLITEAWVTPQSVWRLHPRLRQRFAFEIPARRVTCWTASSVCFAVRQAVRRDNGWTAMMRRNLWFQEKAVANLPANPPRSEVA